MTSSSASGAAGAITAPDATDQAPRPVRRALTTLGQLPPARTYLVGPYRVLVWHQNLLTQLD
jgi:hypothetical protein